MSENGPDPNKARRCLLLGVGLELDPVVAEPEAEQRGAARVLASFGLVLKHRRSALADLVALQLRRACHHRQEEFPRPVASPSGPPAARGASGTSGVSSPITDGQMMDNGR